MGLSTPWGLWQLPHEDQQSRLGRVADSGIDHIFTADHVSFSGGMGIDGLIRLAAMSGLGKRTVRSGVVGDARVGRYALSLWWARHLSELL